jgi:hypothetical protein
MFQGSSLEFAGSAFWGFWVLDFGFWISGSGFTVDVFRAKSSLYMVHIGDFGFFGVGEKGVGSSIYHIGYRV